MSGFKKVAPKAYVPGKAVAGTTVASKKAMADDMGFSSSLKKYKKYQPEGYEWVLSRRWRLLESQTLLYAHNLSCVYCTAARKKSTEDTGFFSILSEGLFMSSHLSS